MKTFIKYSITVILLAEIVVGCNNAPEYPVEPSISFKDVYFKRGDLTNPALSIDSLFVVIDFKDGDGDLGLDEYVDIYDQYQTFKYFKKSDGNWLTLDDRATPPYDTLPPYIFPYTCYNYTTIDSVIYYVQPNENHFNFLIDFYIRKNGVYQKFDWYTVYNSCIETYNGRFPILNNSGQNRPLEGKLTYKMVGGAFLSTFKNDTIMLEMHIKDRALHDSNVVRSFDFALNEITVN